MSRSNNVSIVCAFALAHAAALAAQSNETDLAKASQNPVGLVVSVPLQNNLNFAMGVPGRTQYVLNFQPVYPAVLSRDWLLVSRLIVPTINQPTGAFDSEAGLGDATLQLFAATRNPEDLAGTVWGVGPALYFPTATSDLLGTGRWAAGLTGVTLINWGNWVNGLLVTQQFSFAGHRDRAAIAPFTMQPFINYNLRHGWAIGSSPIITADWNAPNDAWNIPVGGGLSRTFLMGEQPMTITAHAYSNVARQNHAADWNLRLTYTLLFP